jgi:hypothetical protein
LPQRVRTIHEPPPAAKYGQSYENWLSKDSSTTQLLKDFIDDWPFWQNNKDKGTREAWQAGNSYVNHWSSPTTLIPVDDMGTHLGSRQHQCHHWKSGRIKNYSHVVCMESGCTRKEPLCCRM